MAALAEQLLLVLAYARDAIDCGAGGYIDRGFVAALAEPLLLVEKCSAWLVLAYALFAIAKLEFSGSRSSCESSGSCAWVFLDAAFGLLFFIDLVFQLRQRGARTFNL